MSKERKKLSMDEVETAFRNEFQPIQDRFLVQRIPLNLAPSDKTAGVNAPGVYVYWNSQHGVIVVGKSQANSRSRALEHIRDHARGGTLDMATLRGDANAYLLLFNIKAAKDWHWLLGLEAFLETHIDPLIRAGRIG